MAETESTLLQSRMKRLFTEGFTAADIAEKLVFFDSKRNADRVRLFMKEKGLEVVGVRRAGSVAGYVLREDLSGGSCGDCMRRFEGSSVLDSSTSLKEVMEALDSSSYCFVSVRGHVEAVIVRVSIQKPPVRMWLFGMITIMEMFITRQVEARYPDGAWQGEISKGRLQKAQELLEERERRNQPSKLLDCLQFSDKAQILIKDPAIDLQDFGFSSRSEAKRGIREIESLRNNLAHTQDILSYNWETIVAISRRLEKVMTRV